MYLPYSEAKFNHSNITDFYEEKSLDFNILQYIIIYNIVMLTVFQRSNLIIKFASTSGKAIENF